MQQTAHNLMPHTANIMQTPPHHGAAAAASGASGGSASISGYLQQSPVHQLSPQQLLAAMNGHHHAVTTNLFDARQLQTTQPTMANILESKAFYANTQATPTGRFYATTNTSPQGGGGGNPNTILITNNFAQQTQQPLNSAAARTLMGANFNNANNIRIVTAAAGSNTAAALNALQAQQHIFNMQQQQQANNLMTPQKEYIQIGAEHTALYQQQQQQQQLQLHQHFAPQQLTALLPQNFANNPNNGLQLQLPSNTANNATNANTQHFFVSSTPADNLNQTSNKMLNTSLPSAVNTATTSPQQQQSHSTHQMPVVTASNANNQQNSATSSTVVLDRINICINNHYTESNNNNNNTANSGIASPGLANVQMPPQQPSPIIPAIQHKPAVMENLMIDAYATSNSNESNNLIIDEPDSTTATPHTPPTTPPENANCNTNTATSTNSSNLNQSPSTSSSTHLDVEHNQHNIKNSFANVAHNIEEAATAAAQDDSKSASSCCSNSHLSNKAMIVESKILPSLTNVQPQQQSLLTTTPLTPPTPPTPPSNAASKSPPNTPSFKVGEDVFIKRQDDRFYLGTVMQCAQQQYLVRFDDQSEMWCSLEEHQMRRLGGAPSMDANTAGNTISGDSSANDSMEEHQGPMCLACKRVQPQIVVEICERCGRGYHGICTTETSPGSGIYICKRYNLLF